MSIAKDLYKEKESLFLKGSSTLRMLALVGIGIGVIAAGAGFFTQQGPRVWGALLFNLFFFFCLGLGAMALAAMQDVIGASWGRPIRRVQEAFGAFVPVAAGLFLVFIIAVMFDIGGAGKVYRWIADPHMLDHFWGKRTWLQPKLMYARVFFILALITYLVMWQLRLGINRDKAWMDGRHEEAEDLGEEVRVKTKYWSAPILVCYGLGFTFFGFDVMMSLSPTWFSTLWGGWQFAVMMQTLMASLLITMFALKSTRVGEFIQRQQFHDVGKLMHGFTIFFAYLTYAHVLTYWYGNVPEETEYFIHRLHGPWLWFVAAIPLLGFVVPLYAMIPKWAKWTKPWTMTMASVILFAQWLTYQLIVQPEVIKGEDFLKGIGPLLEVGMFLGMAGLFVTTFLWFARRYPMLPVADPLLEEAVHGGH
jgi:hypothetical protein